MKKEMVISASRVGMETNMRLRKYLSIGSSALLPLLAARHAASAIGSKSDMSPECPNGLPGARPAGHQDIAV
jgi:hypothetical protein